VALEENFYILSVKQKVVPAQEGSQIKGKGKGGGEKVGRGSVAFGGGNVLDWGEKPQQTSIGVGG